jgi:hypothetical protein
MLSKCETTKKLLERIKIDLIINCIIAKQRTNVAVCDATGAA